MFHWILSSRVTFCGHACTCIFFWGGGFQFFVLKSVIRGINVKIKIITLTAGKEKLTCLLTFFLLLLINVLVGLTQYIYTLVQAKMKYYFLLFGKCGNYYKNESFKTKTLLSPSWQLLSFWQVEKTENHKEKQVKKFKKKYIYIYIHYSNYHYIVNLSLNYQLCQYFS